MVKQFFTLNVRKICQRKNKYVKEPENSREVKDILFRNTALNKLIGKWLHAESG